MLAIPVWGSHCSETKFLWTEDHIAVVETFLSSWLNCPVDALPNLVLAQLKMRIQQKKNIIAR
jgi:hypothetical protein